MIQAAAEVVKTTFQLRVLYQLLFSYVFGASMPDVYLVS
jgi:hypothetical protein